MNFDRAHLQESGGINDLPLGNGAKPAHNNEHDDEELKAAIGNLRASLLHKLREFTVALEGEHDLDKLKKQLDCLEGLLRVFRFLRG